MKKAEVKKQLRDAKSKLKLCYARCNVLKDIYQESVEAAVKADGVVAQLEEALEECILIEEDAIEKHGPVVKLSSGSYVILVFLSSEPWPQYPGVRVQLRETGQQRRQKNLDLRPGGQYGDAFSEEDVEIVLDALFRVDTSNPLAYPDPDAATKIRPYIATWPKSWNSAEAIGP